MATITDTADNSALPVEVNPSAAQLYTMLIANEQALRLAVFGDREGAMSPHDHAAKGGRLLGRGIAGASFGPYGRPGGTIDLGIAVYPPAAGVASYQTTPKMVAHFGVYIPGGVNGIAVRVGARLTGGAGTRAVTIRATLQPYSKAGFIPTWGGVTGLGVLSTTGANDFISVRIQLATLAQLGDPNTGRWFELTLWAVTDPPAGTTFRLLGAKVMAVPVASTPPPHVVGNPLVAVQVSEVILGSYIVEKVIGKAARMLDGLTLATIGRVPGKLTTSGAPLALTDRASKWRAALEQIGRGIHQHTGKRYFDGAIIPGQLSAGFFPGDLGDDAGSTADGNSVRGLKINPAGVGDPSLGLPPLFRSRVSLARGTERIVLRAAFMSAHTAKQGNLACYVRVWPCYYASYRVGVRDNQGALVTTDPASPGLPSSVVSLEHGQKLEALSIFGGYHAIYLDPEDGEIWVPNDTRNAQGLVGHWTDDALLPVSSTPGARLSASYNYRVSKPLYIKVDTKGRTADVFVDTCFIMTDQTGTQVLTSKCQWIAIGSVEGA